MVNSRGGGGETQMLRLERQTGFTLIEAMVVVSILAVLAGLGTPAFREMIASQRVRNAASDLLSDMMLARSEAIRRNTPITISAIDASWSNGWTVAMGTTETIRQRSFSSGLLTIEKKSGTSDTIIFGTTGRATTSDFQMNFTASGISNNEQKRCVRGSAAGGQKVLKGPCP